MLTKSFFCTPLEMHLQHFPDANQILLTLSRLESISQSVSQSRQSGSHFVCQVAAANVATFIKVIELNEGKGVRRSIPLVTRIYLPVFTRNFSACFAGQFASLQKMPENFCFVFSALTSYKHSIIHSCIRCENKFSSLTHWQLVLNLQITCVYLSRPLMLMIAKEVFKDLKDLKLKDSFNSFWSCLKTVNAIGDFVNGMKLRKYMLFMFFIGFLIVMFLSKSILFIIVVWSLLFVINISNNTKGSFRLNFNCLHWFKINPHII